MQISLIIPTIGRTKDINNLLSSFNDQTKLPYEIIIIEQETKKLENIKNKYKNLHINYYYLKNKSLTKAKNFGVTKATGDIIGFLDDDIILDKNYILYINKFFTEHPKALGVQGLITNFVSGHVKKVGGSKFVYYLYNKLAKLFLLNNSSDTNKLLLSGRNQYASNIKNNKIITCEWLSGIGNYKKEVFKEFSFDESLGGYALGEDKLFSYPIKEKYNNSLYVDSKIKCEHHHADSGRPNGKKWVKMRVYNTWYLWNTLLAQKGLKARVAFWWANLGDVKIAFLGFLLRKNSFNFFIWHISEYVKLLFK